MGNGLTMNVKEGAGCECHVFCGTFPRALWEVVDRAKGEDITWPCHRIHNNCQQVLAQPETMPVPDSRTLGSSDSAASAGTACLIKQTVLSHLCMPAVLVGGGSLHRSRALG